MPVEDAVLLVYLDRYIYLVSGWHDLGNVNLVQVLDTANGTWQQATPWPGAPGSAIPALPSSSTCSPSGTERASSSAAGARR